jgi:hypothetical protein
LGSGSRWGFGRVALFVAAGAVLAGLPARAAASEAAGGSKIVRVIVFSDRAEVTRAAKADCRQNAAEVTFSLPPSLDERTLRAEAGGRAKVLGTTTRLVPVEPEHDLKRAELDRELRKVQDRIREDEEITQGKQARARITAAFGSYFSSILN